MCTNFSITIYERKFQPTLETCLVAENQPFQPSPPFICAV